MARTDKIERQEAQVFGLSRFTRAFSMLIVSIEATFMMIKTIRNETNREYDFKSCSNRRQFTRVPRKSRELPCEITEMTDIL